MLIFFFALIILFCKAQNKKKPTSYALLELMGQTYCYHQAVAYLFSLDKVCFEHINDIYDFADNCIISEGLDKSWQTGTSKRPQDWLLICITIAVLMEKHISEMTALRTICQAAILLHLTFSAVSMHLTTLKS
ncbi:MAG: DUF6075 family protein [Clostridia bacterium]|nr:DUF6075 family protein [Clostridia bacterium]